MIDHEETGATFSYLWNTGATTPSISNLDEGMYIVTVTPDNGCEAMVDTFIITQPEPLRISVEVIQHETGERYHDGIAEVKAT
ncbi:MAG: hypothetical protein ACK5LR_05315, partial [Mangrovibacterium sp.]